MRGNERRSGAGWRGAVAAACAAVALGGVALAGATKTAPPPKDTWTVRWLSMDPSWLGCDGLAIGDDGTVLGSGYEPADTPWGYRGLSVVWRGDARTILSAPGEEPGDECAAQRMNAKGQVSGWYYPSALGPYVTHAALWDSKAGTAKDLHPVPSVVIGDMTFDNSLAFGINAKGDVVGVIEHQPEVTWYAYVWTAGGDNDRVLYAPDPSIPTEAVAINAAGTVAGEVIHPGWNRRACVWSAADEFLDLHAEIAASLPGLDVTESWVNDIDGDGTVAGTFFLTYDYEPFPFLWSPSDGLQVLPKGDSGSGDVMCVQHQWAVGFLGGFWWRPQDPLQPAIWSKGNLFAVDPPEGYPWTGLIGVNSKGDAVGQAWLTDYWNPGELAPLFPRGFVLEHSGGGK